MEMVIHSEKISRFSRCALRPALGAILKDIGGKNPGNPAMPSSRHNTVMEKSIGLMADHALWKV